ncbi:Zn-dependent exopeptidase [Flagelloscypha sp. PMI_526]|nr:Zn-dependent exopeptidase [Flagelloscypha sp. PMI_526]
MKFTAAFGLACAAIAFVSAVPVTHDEIEAKSSEGLRLLKLEEDADPIWVTEDEKLDLLKAKKQFFDVTNTWEYKAGRIAEAKAEKEMQIAAFPTPSHTTAIKALTSQLSTTNMNTYLSTLTAFNNRYYTSTTGLQASTYIRDTVAGWATSGVTVSFYNHTWREPSVVAKIPGKTASTPVTILGAHMDSINLNSPSSGRAPGADDDGSGTVNNMEIFRVLMANGFAPATPVEFHWYAGEEAGLLGSQDIAADYDSQGIDVKAMMELDMTAYYKPGTTPVFALEADYISTTFNTWLKTLIPLHSTMTVTMDTKCGYACSDHASWYEYGYPTSMPFEAVTGNDNPQIHSTGDTTSVSGFSWTHSLEFAKIALAYVYEMSA